MPDAKQLRVTIVAFVLLLTIVTAHAVMETARDAVFLLRLDPGILPWAYLAIAAVATAMVALLQRRRRPMSRASLSTLVLACAAVSLPFAWALKHDIAAGPVAFGFYVWVGVYATMIVSLSWSLVSGLFQIDGAKRMFAWIGSGASLGAVAGSAIAQWLAARMDAPALIWVGAALLAFAAMVPWLFPVGGVETIKARRRQRRYGGLWQQPEAAYLGHAAAFVLIVTVAFTLLDWLFKDTVYGVLEPSRYAWFFATFYLITNTAALVVQVLIAGPLFRFAGVTGALALLPALIVAGCTAAWWLPATLPILLTKAMDGALRNSVHRTGVELFFVPLRSHVRQRFKPLLDTLAQRGGQALGSLLLLLFAVLGMAEEGTLLAIGSLMILAFVVMLRMKPHYVQLFRHYVRDGQLHTDAQHADMDLLSLEAVLAALSSPNDDEVVAALDLLAAEDKVHVIPALILLHPSSVVALKAFDVFAHSERSDLKQIALRQIGDSDADVRMAALRMLLRFRPPKAFLDALYAKPDAVTRATALVGYVTLGHMSVQEFSATAEQFVVDESAETVAALARAIAHTEHRDLHRLLPALGNRPELSARRGVLEAMREWPAVEFLPYLQTTYAHAETRAEAEAVIVALGAAGFAALEHMYDEPETSFEVRAAIPYSMARFEPQLAQPALLARLEREINSALAYKLLRALGRSHRIDANVPLDMAVLRRIFSENVARGLGYLEALKKLGEHGGADRDRVLALLVELLLDRGAESMERCFRILDIMEPREDFERLYYAAVRGDAVDRANAEEVLINVLPPTLHRDLIRLLHMNAIVPHHKAPVAETTGLAVDGLADDAEPPLADLRPVTDVLGTLLDDASATVRAMAAYVVAKYRLTRLAERVYNIEPSVSEAVNEVFHAAQAMLRRAA